MNASRSGLMTWTSECPLGFILVGLGFMRAMASAIKVVLLGEKSLAPRAIYDVAHGLARAVVDPAALDGACKAFPNNYNLLPPPPTPIATEKRLSVQESRAALLVILHRLLESGLQVRKDVPVLICEALNSGVKLELQGSSQPLLDLAEIFYKLGVDQSLENLKDKLLGLDVKEFALAKEELEALQASSRDSASLGTAAISVHLASYLVEISDFVAGLSCDALKAKAPFDDKVYRQDSSHNAVADAAKTMRSLLLKPSPLRKGFEAEFISSIPEVHGSFKESCKSMSGLLRVEMNRVSTFSEKLASWPATTESSSPQLSFLLADAFVRFNVSLNRVVLYSVQRINEGIKAIAELDGEARREWIDGVLDEAREAGAAAAAAQSGKFAVFRNALNLVQAATKVLALEAAVALRLLSLRDEVNGKAKFVLGKGTAYSRDILVTKLGEKRDGETDVLFQWFQKLQKFLQPVDDSLQNFIDDVKTLLESSSSTMAIVPKGTRDFLPKQMLIRETSFNIITKIFKRHGAVSIDTPVFELRDTLMGKYGEDSKLIFDLADQGGQMYSLRYDLTVPLARYMATNNVQSIKRFHIAKVYRRDNPNLSAGRYREFYQCDFDIAGGQFQEMVPDMEVIKVLTELLDELKIGEYEIKLNHRKILDGMLEICGVPPNKFRSICSSIDKLDKSPWEKVRTEMVAEKGLPEDVADRIGEHVVRRGNPFLVLQELQQQPEYVAHPGSSKALSELSTLFHFLEAARCLDRVVFDLSLARGLDYYTGIIYEAVFKGSTQVGSIAAGGRYDNLIGSMFPDAKGKNAKQITAVGVSLGIERVLCIREKIQNTESRENETQVKVIMIGRDLADKAIELVTELWAAGINTEFDIVSPSKVKTVLSNVVKAGVPFAVFLGESELRDGIVQLKDLKMETQTAVNREQLVTTLKGLLKM